MTKKKVENSFFENSATVTINSIAQEKSLRGISVFNLSVGEPKLLPHPFIKKAVIEAMHEGKTLYPPVSGIPELKALATAWMNHVYHCFFQEKNCLVVNGGKLGIYLLLQSLLKKGDEVIITSPYWVSYPAITKLFSGTPIIIETKESEEWKLKPQALKDACSSKTKILILNNANNPTGILYTQSELEKILKIAKEQQFFVISDEVYSGLIYDQHTYVSCGSFNQYHDNVVIIQSCSKNFSMTGWRVGFVFANEKIIQQLLSLLSQSTSGASTISQWAAVAAIKHAEKINHWVCKNMQKRRNILLEALHQYLGITMNPPASALYFFIALNRLGVNNTHSVEFCMKLLSDANIACVPGLAFGKEGYIRLSFGSDERDLKLGIEAFADYLVKNNDTS